MQASCQWGRLTATIDDRAEPMVVLCHCTDCQRRTGSPFGVIGYFPKEAVTIRGGAKEFARDTYSGHRLINGFCPDCGSTIYVLLTKNEALVGVPVGALADPRLPVPARAVWEQNRHAWVTLPETVERFERGTDGR